MTAVATLVQIGGRSAGRSVRLVRVRILRFSPVAAQSPSYLAISRIKV